MKFRVCSILFVLFSSIAFAEPTPSVRWLMNEPASLFDIGILRLREMNRTLWAPKFQLLLSKENLELDDLGLGNVVYNWEENRINIAITVSGKISEKKCTVLLKEYKNIIAKQYSYVKNEQSRNDLVELSESMLVSAFDHINHSSSLGPKNWKENIADLITITLGIKENIKANKDDDKVLAQLFSSKSLFCTTALKRDDISIKTY